MIIKIYESLKYRVWNRFVQKYYKKKMAACGTDVTLGIGFSACGFENLNLANHVYVGDGARFLCALAPIIISDYCMFGPEVMIITGNHRIDVIGKYMYDVYDKIPENDQPVIIEKDVWVGARAIILKGSRIGTGSVIAAGAIVSGIVPPYSIYLGKDKIKPRFTDEQLLKHQEELKKNEKSYSQGISIYSAKNF